jgi:hypothetical protein
MDYALPGQPASEAIGTLLSSLLLRQSRDAIGGRRLPRGRFSRVARCAEASVATNADMRGILGADAEHGEPAPRPLRQRETPDEPSGLRERLIQRRPLNSRTALSNTRIDNILASDGGPYGKHLRGLGTGGFGRSGGTAPLAMHKVYPSRHDELVHGAEIARFDLKALKRMLAAGEKPYVLNSGGMGGRRVVAPALLFEELDLAKIDRDFDRPPILPNPPARAKEAVEEKNQQDRNTSYRHL